MNSIAFMNTLCGRKNTADVRTYTQQSSSSSINNHHHHHHETVAEYIGKLWFLPKKYNSHIKFRETIRIISLGDGVVVAAVLPPNHDATTTTTDGGDNGEEEEEGTTAANTTTTTTTTTSTVECHTQYYNGKEWIDCSKVICHFTSSSSSLLRQQRQQQQQQIVKMTVDTKLLVRLPLPSVASNAVRKKIGSVFKEIVTEFFLDNYNDDDDDDDYELSILLE